PRFAHDQLDAAGLKLSEVHLHQLVDHPPFAAGDAGHVDARRPSYHSQAFGRVDKRNGLGAINDVLAGQAGDVWAGAADHRSFDDDGFLVLSRESPGEYLARNAAANDQILKVLGVHYRAPFRGQESYAAARTLAFQD